MIKLQLKYYCFIIVFVFFSCKEEKNNLNKEQTSTLITKVKKEDINSTLFEEMKISSLPAGNEEVIKFFHKLNYNQDHGYILKNEYEKMDNIDSDLDIYLKAKSVKIDFYKYPQKNNYDFGSRFRYELDSINTSKDYYLFSSRLPDIGNNKIYLTHSNDPDEKFDDFIRNIDLVILDKQNKIVNSLNLNYFSVSSEIFSGEDRPVKHFFIDKDYTIHVKYFLYWGEGSITTLAYIKYKIQNDGTIIRYFDQKEGSYKSYIEEGIVKNHTKEGEWKEYLGGQEKMYAKIHYKNGVVDGKIDIYDVNAPLPPMADPDQTIHPKFTLKIEGDKYVEVE